MSESKKRGGRREGAGRPALYGEKMTPRRVCLTDAQWVEFQRRGGAPWLRALLDTHADHGTGGDAEP